MGGIVGERFRKNKLFVFYSCLVGGILAIAIFAPWLVPQDIYQSDLRLALQAPSDAHWFGTDKLGRDVLSRLIYGTRLSLFMATTIVALMAAIGTLVGILAGYFQGRTEWILMRFCDIMISFPGIILAIAIAGILGGSIVNSILALTVVGWAKYARLVRSLVLAVRNEEYIAAAILCGCTTPVVLRRHILPNVLPMVMVTAGMDIGTMMLEVAGLSFLGFGAQPPTPEWGLMLNEGRQYLQLAPWLMFFPGAAILVVVSIFNLWGDSLRDVLDPRR